MRVRTLLGAAQVETARPCLVSLLRHATEPIDLVVHDDGTLTHELAVQLSEDLCGAQIVRREEADAKVEEQLARFPATMRFRAENPLAVKLVDVVLLGEGETVHYCDADILFLRPHRGLFVELPEGIEARFMTDYQCAYSIRSWDLVREASLRPALRVNTGIVQVRRAAYDREVVEWFLGRTEYHRTRQWVEQTCWALLAGRCSAALLDPDQFSFPFDPPTEASGVLAMHFIGPLRERLPSWLPIAENRGTGGRVEVISSAPAVPCSPLHMAADELKRLSGRWSR